MLHDRGRKIIVIKSDLKKKYMINKEKIFLFSIPGKCHGEIIILKDVTVVV